MFSMLIVTSFLIILPLKSKLSIQNINEYACSKSIVIRSRVVSKFLKEQGYFINEGQHLDCNLTREIEKTLI